LHISIHAEYIEITARQTALALDPPVPEEAAEEGETEEEVEAFAVIAMNSCQDYFTPVPSFFFKFMFNSLCHPGFRTAGNASRQPGQNVFAFSIF
jgi:hypothetical protein